MALTCSVSLGTQAAKAGTITLLSQGTALWKATWSDTLPKDLLVDQGQVYDENGTPTKRSTDLIETVTFAHGMDDLVIKFTQQTAPKNASGSQDETGLGASGGLFFRIKQTITNGTNLAWNGFRQEILDKKPDPPLSQDKFGTETHLAMPHFHNIFLDSNPLSLVSPERTGDGVAILKFGIAEPTDGTVAPSQSFNVLKEGRKNLRMHEIERKDIMREFHLVQTPMAVPEPNTLLLLLVGLTGLSCAARWNKRAIKVQ